MLGEFRIANRQFSEALTSWTSNEFQMLASEVIKSVKNCTKQNYKHNIIVKVRIILSISKHFYLSLILMLC